MVNIQKNTSPQSLSQYKRESISQYGESLNAGNIFDDFRYKPELRTALAIEQGYVCAYCMSRIEDDQLETKIEHCHSQSEYPSEKLDYNNLLLCCPGNSGKRARDQYCDTKKDAISLSYNPADQSKDLKILIRYQSSDGTIYSEHSGLNTELNDVLNLNHVRLMSNRKKVIMAVDEALRKKPGLRSLGELVRLMNKWKGKNQEGQYQEYYGVALYRLSKHQSYGNR